LKADFISIKEKNSCLGNSSCHLEYPSSEVPLLAQLAVLLDLIEWGAVVGGGAVWLRALDRAEFPLGARIGSFLHA
jgi:hypothetical protein